MEPVASPTPDPDLLNYLLPPVKAEVFEPARRLPISSSPIVIADSSDEADPIDHLSLSSNIVGIGPHTGQSHRVVRSSWQDA